MIRTFIVVEIPDDIKRELGKLQSDLRSLRCDISWTKADNIHLTVKFLGDLGEEQIKSACTATKAAVQNAAPFTMRLNGIGVFPNPRNARVLWAGLDGEIAPLSSLHEKI